MYDYHREKLHVNHFWGVKGLSLQAQIISAYTRAFLHMQKRMRSLEMWICEKSPRGRALITSARPLVKLSLTCLKSSCRQRNLGPGAQANLHVVFVTSFSLKWIKIFGNSQLFSSLSHTGHLWLWAPNKKAFNSSKLKKCYKLISSKNTLKNSKRKKIIYLLKVMDKLIFLIYHTVTGTFLLCQHLELKIIWKIIFTL